MYVLKDQDFLKKNEVVIEMEDRGYQFGDGIYEVIRVYNGKMFRIKEHLDRLYKSAESISLFNLMGEVELQTKLRTLIELNGISNGYIYLQFTRGVAPRAHAFPEQAAPVLTAYANPKERPVQAMETGFSVITTEDIRWLRCDIKSLNLLGAVLANQKAKAAGKDEAILHRDGTVTECSLSNVSLVKNGIIYTHPANNLILNGITRQVMIELATSLSIPLVEKPFTLHDLAEADEVFASGTTIEIMPIVSIDDQAVGTGTPGPVTRQLQQAFEQLLPA